MSQPVVHKKIWERSREYWDTLPFLNPPNLIKEPMHNRWSKFKYRAMSSKVGQKLMCFDQ